MIGVPADDELVEVIDDAGTVVDTVSRAEMRRGNLRHRTVFVAVLNDNDELLVHRRAEWKDLWPGAWDVAFGGVVDVGEAWIAAAQRELDEEAGVRLELGYLGEESYDDDHVRELARIYLARTAGPFDFSDGEVVEAVWVPLTEVRGWLGGRTVCPDGVALVLPRLDWP